MRLKLVLLAAVVLGATALPASAQSYRENCRQARGNNQAAGLVLGGILGGVLGSNVAASGHRHDGTALGAVLGGVVGSEIGRGSTSCDPTYYGPNTSYPASPAYGYGSYNSGYAPPPPVDYSYDPEPGYAYEMQPYYRDSSSRKHDRDLYPYDTRSYKHDDDYAGRDCTEATQITRLPDGTEIRRPVEACRTARYGDWHVRD
jgi:hypothetical protein